MAIGNGVVIAILIGAASLICGCSAIGAKPWDRDLLAKQGMHFASAHVRRSPAIYAPGARGESMKIFRPKRLKS